MNRRTFTGLISLAGAASVIALPVAPSGDPVADLARKLVSILRDRRSAAELGRRFLARSPEVDVRDLAHALAGSREGLERLLTTDHGGVRAILQRQSRSDFRHGRTTNLEGWILSETEARLAGLAALI